MTLVNINSSETIRQDALNLPQAIRGREYLDHIKKINDIFYDQIKLSDQKAAYIFTFMIALLVTSTRAKSVFAWRHDAGADALEILCSASLAAFSIFSMVCAISSVLPRHAQKSTSLFWGTWQLHREAFRLAAHQGNVEYLFQQYLDNADVLASLAKQKFKLVRLAFLGMIGTVLTYVSALVFL